MVEQRLCTDALDTIVTYLTADALQAHQPRIGGLVGKGKAPPPPVVTKG